MGLASKSRGGDSNNPNGTNSTSTSNPRRKKTKHKQQHLYPVSSSSSNHYNSKVYQQQQQHRSDDNNNLNGRGGPKSRLLVRAKHSSSSNHSNDIKNESDMSNSGMMMHSGNSNSRMMTGSSNHHHSSSSHHHHHGSKWRKKKKKKALDPTLLARGMSARSIGARVNHVLTTLQPSEKERDVRHMMAYHAACITYAQQYYTHVNQTNNKSKEQEKQQQKQKQLLLLPIKIDPEEEKRLQQKRQSIWRCEESRQFLETEYLSLRAHYVYLLQNLKQTRHVVSGQTAFFQNLVQTKAKLLAIRRVQCAIARDIQSLLLPNKHQPSNNSTSTISNSNSSTANSADTEELLAVWNSLEQELSSKEDSMDHEKLRQWKWVQKARMEAAKKHKPIAQKIGTPPSNAIPWDCHTLPKTPYDLPLYISYLTSAPDRILGHGCGEVWGANANHVQFTNDDNDVLTMSPKSVAISQVEEDEEALRMELQHEIDENTKLQQKMMDGRKKSDIMCSMMTMLRTETEAILNRHNTILSTKQARRKAQDLLYHKQQQAEQLQQEQAEAAEDDLNKEEEDDDISEDTVTGDEEDEEDDTMEEEEEEDKETAGTTPSETLRLPKADADEVEEDNDGDDEGDFEEEEDEEEEEDNGPIREVIVHHKEQQEVEDGEEEEGEEEGEEEEGEEGEEEGEMDDEEGMIMEDEEDGEMDDDEEGEIHEEISQEAQNTNVIAPVKQQQQRGFTVHSDNL